MKAARGRRHARRRTNGDATFWRNKIGPKVVRSAAAGAKGLRWSQALFEALMEELHVDESLEELIGRPVTKLTRRQYPQAVALALILRHSWRSDDLADILDRVGLTTAENA